MGDLTKDFSRWEFACKCGCGFATVDFELVTMLQMMRDNLDRAITVNSGCRCPDHNEAEGGSEDSQHLYARAADITVENVDAATVYEVADEMGFGGVGEYDGYTHVDTRTGYARW